MVYALKALPKSRRRKCQVRFSCSGWDACFCLVRSIHGLCPGRENHKKARTLCVLPTAAQQTVQRLSNPSRRKDDRRASRRREAREGWRVSWDTLSKDSISMDSSRFSVGGEAAGLIAIAAAVSVPAVARGSLTILTHTVILMGSSSKFMCN